MSTKPNNSQAPDLQDRLAVAMEAAGHGVWRWNLKDGSAWYSDTFKKILGFQGDEFPDRFESFASHVHKDDIGRVHHAVAIHLEGKSALDLEFKMRTKEGIWRWVRVRGCIIDLDGQKNVMTGTLTGGRFPRLGIVWRPRPAINLLPRCRIKAKVRANLKKRARIWWSKIGRYK